MIPVDEAVDRILDRVEPLAARPCPLPESLGLVLAQDLVAQEDHPPFDNSAMDGFAVRSQDLEAAPVVLPIVEDIAAGSWPQRSVEAGTASRVMTGAPMPPGADSVIVVEQTRSLGLVDGVEQVEMQSPVGVAENIRWRGEHVAQGKTGLARGTVMSPSAVAMAAYLGYPELLCHPRLRVAVVSTGDELTEPTRPEGTPAAPRGPGAWPIGPGQIRNSNAYGLEAKLARLGCLPTRAPAVPDDPDRIAMVLQDHLSRHDALITSAGVSMGEKDYILRVLQSMGAELHFWKVAMRPGRPLGFGTWQGKPIFALPGNPVSSLVTFEIFCRPALLKMMGYGHRPPRVYRARSGETLRKKAGLRLYYRALLRQEGGETWAYPTGPQDSHLLTSLVQADVLMILPEGHCLIEKGSPLDILPVDQPADKGFC